MEIDFKLPPVTDSTPLSTEVEVALAAASLIKMGIPVTPTRNGSPTEDPRTPDQRKDPVATYFALLDQPGLGIAIKTGPSSGVTALTAYTNDEASGIHALLEVGLFCTCHCTAIRHDVIVGQTRMHAFHTCLYRTGKDSFAETEIPELSGVFTRKSGSLIAIPPSAGHYVPHCGWEEKLSYELNETLASKGVVPMPEELRKKIRRGEKSARAAGRKRSISRGVLPDLFTPIAAGNRNNELTRRVGYLLGTERHSEKEVLDVLLNVNRRFCEPPLEEHEVRTIVRSIAKRHARHG